MAVLCVPRRRKRRECAACSGQQFETDGSTPRMKQTGKKPDKFGKWGWVALAVIVVAAAVLVLVLWPDAEAEEPQQTVSFEIPGYTALEASPSGDLDDNLYLVNVGTYTGSYVEDGSDEPVENVLAMIVENKSEAVVEYAVLEMDCGDGNTARFSISALPAGACVLVLAEDRMCAEGLTVSAMPQVSRFAAAETAVLDFEDDFTLYPATGVINIENISGRDFTEDVSVCYKTWQYGLYIGGIAYRARVEGGIAAGAIAQSIQPHYNSETSAILYMTYGE